MRYILLILTAASSVAYGDGWVYENGHFPEGATTTLKITTEQMQQINLYMRCRKNDYTPYIFILTPEQHSIIKKQTGIDAGRLYISQSYGITADEGAELSYNVGVNFNENEIEIPHIELVPEETIVEYEKEMGWEASPLMNVGKSYLLTSECPK